MIIVHPWKSHRVLLQLGFPNVFCLSPNSSTKNGGGGLRVLHTPMLGVTAFFHQKVDCFHPGEGAAFSAHEKKTVRILLGVSGAQTMESIYHKNSMLNGRNVCWFMDGIVRFVLGKGRHVSLKICQLYTQENARGS